MANAKNIQEQHQKVLLDLLKLPENKECADCGAKGPRWASASIGVFVCIKCSGIHRSMGTHISFVRSVTLDKWTTEQVKQMEEVGNGKAREIYEALLPDNFRRPHENDNYALEQFIRAKYERKEFMQNSGKSTTKRSRPRAASNGEPAPAVQKKNQSKAASTPTAPAKNLLDFEEPAGKSGVAQMDNGFGDFSGFQSASSFQTGPTYHQAVSDPFAGATFVSATPVASVPTTTQKSNFNTEAFFSGEANAAKGKDSIMSLFNSPTTATMPLNQVPSTKQSIGPNYNVVLPGLGMPAIPTMGQPLPMRGPIMGAPMMGGMTPGINLGMNMGQGVQIGYNNRPVGNVGPNPTFVNTNGYVNSNYQAQRSPHLNFM